MLLDIYADHAAAAMEHLVQIVIHDKAEIGLAAGAVEQHDLVAVILLKHRCNQFDIMVDLIVFADHIVLQLAVCGQNTDLAQQRGGLIDTDQILTAAGEQGIGGVRLFFITRLTLRLLHLHAACSSGERHDSAALGIDKHALVKFFSLRSKKCTECSGIRGRGTALKTKRPVLPVERKFGIKFFLSRSECADRTDKIITIFRHSRRNACEQQLQLGNIALLHSRSVPFCIAPPGRCKCLSLLYYSTINRRACAIR